MKLAIKGFPIAAEAACRPVVVGVAGWVYLQARVMPIVRRLS